MREFTKEEKELIVNTPITIECFDVTQFAYSLSKEELERGFRYLEAKRKAVLVCMTKEVRERNFNRFVEVLSTTPYKVVKL
jgi:hypothetical protein